MSKAISIQEQIKFVKSLPKSKERSAVLKTLAVILDGRTNDKSSLYVLTTNDTEKVKRFLGEG